MGMATFGETRSVMHTIIIVKGMIPMRNVLKKALCLLLALCMAASLGACYSEDNTWAAKHGDDVMPIGSYIYYLSSAYTDAGSRVSANDKILEGTIDGQGAKEWIKDRALAYIGAYYYVCDKFDELGLALTDEDRNAIENGASAYWSYYKSGMEAMGISEESFTKAYAEQNVRAQLVLEALYGEGGEKEVPESEMLDYYQETYSSYEYMYVSKSKLDEDGNSVAITDEEAQGILDSLDDFCERINSEDMTLAEAYNEYSQVSMTTPSHEAPGAMKKSQMHPNISSALPDMEDNEVKVIEVETGVYLLQKLSVEEYFDTQMEDEAQRSALLTEYKGTEFNEDAMEQGKALAGVEVNEKALKKIPVDKVVTNKDQTGASVAPTSSGEDEAESEAEDDAKAASSQAKAESEAASEAGSEKQ